MGLGFYNIIIVKKKKSFGFLLVSWIIKEILF